MRCQRIIFSAYRSDQYSDPEGYMASLGAVLEQYPNDVIAYITDPRTGVQRGSKWPPTIAEIVAACDARVADLERQKRYRNWGKNDPTLLSGPETPRSSLDELKAKYGPNWGLGEPETPRKPSPQAPTADQLKHHYQHYNLAFEAKDARDHHQS